VMDAIDAPSGRVAFGFPSVLSPLLSYELLVRVRTAYPNILLHISEASGWLLRERLVNGRLDVGLLYVGQAERGLAVEPLVLEELFYCTADPDPAPIRLAEATQTPLLLAAHDANSRHVAEEAFKKRGLTVTPAAEIDTIITFRRAIASGMGNGIAPWCALYDGDGKVALNFRRFADAEMVRPVALCFPEVAQRSPAIEAVAATLKTLVLELVENGTWQGASLIDPAAEQSRMNG